MPATDPAAFKDLAIAAAREAGDLLLELSADDIKYTMKNAHDIQAEGDLRSEKLIIDRIKASFPDHNILAEETGAISTDSDFLWVIDPIDGTINFARHIEEYCISIGLSYRDELILGVIYQPVLDKLYLAEKGGGATLNGQKITVSTETELINSLVATGNTSDIDKRQKTFQQLIHISAKVRHVRMFGSSALEIARMAEGQLDWHFKNGFHYWDYAAGIIILTEAGGTVTDLAGQPISQHSGNILATNGRLHQAALDLIHSS